VERALERVALAGLDRRPVQALSGGQQQRVALARALAPEPPVLLLDEPLSNLDAALREKTRDELRALLKQVGITAVFVTHDQEEAFALSDRIAVLRAGQLQQVGTPEELYLSPDNAFVAGFVGKANFLEGRVVGREGPNGTVELAGGVRWRVRLHGHPADRVQIVARPEALRLLPTEDEADLEVGGRSSRTFAGRVRERRFAGSVTQYRVDVPGLPELLVTRPGQGGVREGAVRVTVEDDPPLHAFPLEGA
jgi:iron(III) transport system ATP-binding protein